MDSFKSLTKSPVPPDTSEIKDDLRRSSFIDNEMGESGLGHSCLAVTSVTSNERAGNSEVGPGSAETAAIGAAIVGFSKLLVALTKEDPRSRLPTDDPSVMLAHS